jgi:hypothetical protein
MEPDHINHPVLKATSAGLAVVAGYTWQDVAALLAAVYTAILIGEWAWKRVINPWLRRRRGN